VWNISPPLGFDPNINDDDDNNNDYYDNDYDDVNNNNNVSFCSRNIAMAKICLKLEIFVTFN
jgi:hypothetical protein